MKYTLCKKLCVECPFGMNAVPGSMNIPAALALIEVGGIFPCHMELEKVTGDASSGVESYYETQDEFKVCRGFIEAQMKSHIPATTPIIAEMYRQVDYSGGMVATGNLSMTLRQAVLFHSDSQLAYDDTIDLIVMLQGREQ